MYKTGKITVKVADRDVDFHFGMNAQAMCEQILNGDVNVGFSTWARAMIWAGAKVVKTNGYGSDFDLDAMGDLIDQMSDTDYLAVMDEAGAAMGKMKDLTVKVMGTEQINKIVKLMAASQVQA
jgi:hypothetical protein